MATDTVTAADAKYDEYKEKNSEIPGEGEFNPRSSNIGAVTFVVVGGSSCNFPFNEVNIANHFRNHLKYSL
jgi:hypothetical protein